MSTGSQTEGLKAWRQIWIPILLEGLSSPDTHLRHRVSLYAVPVPLGLDQASLLPLLQQVLQPQPGQLATTDAQVFGTDGKLNTTGLCLVTSETMERGVCSSVQCMD